MTQRDDLQQKSRPAPECIQHRCQERREYRPVRKSMQDRQLPIVFDYRVVSLQSR
jgi:hypothetical protein